jgi:hypothetical protein
MLADAEANVLCVMWVTVIVGGRGEFVRDQEG